MANVKITELTAATALAGTDVLPIVDVGADATKKVSVSDLLRNLPDGTASAPALAFADDQNTGVLSPGDNSLAFATSGTQRLVIDSSGRLLVGTTTEGHANADNLTIADTGNCGITLRSGTTSSGFIYFSDATSGTDEYDGYIHYSHNTRALRFATAASERLRIDSSGNVGIGTSSPSTLLHLNSTGEPKLRIQDADLTNRYVEISQAGGGTFFRSRADSSNGSFIFSGLGGGTEDEFLRIDNSGNVGIGTSSPSNNLDILSTTSGATVSARIGSTAASGVNNANLIINNGGTGNATLRFDYESSTNRASIGVPQSTQALFFTTAGSERMRIDSSGNVGIGTTSPSAKLHVNSGTANTCATFQSSDAGAAINLTDSDARSTIEQNGSTLSIIADTDASDASSNIRLKVDNNTNLIVDSSGNVGIGVTNPSSYYQHGDNLVVGNSGASSGITIRTGNVNQGILAFADGTTGGSQQYAGYVIYDHNVNDMLFATGATERMRIDSSGRLLVGHSSNSMACNVECATTGGNNFAAGRFAASTGGPDIVLRKSRNATVGSHTIVQDGDDLGNIFWGGSNGSAFKNAARITAQVDGTPGTGDDMPGRILFYTSADGSSSPTERMRLTGDANPALHLGKTSFNVNEVGVSIGVAGSVEGLIEATRSDAECLKVGRNTSDGKIVEIRQGSSEEGNISVSGSTVSYNGGHLARWSQLAGGAERIEILRGSVLSNLDEMCEWGEEDNEQLNRMKVSDVEGDVNVAGVFQGWDDDDDTYTNDFYCAMTGDFVIRVAQGTTVARGDLLMSAGDGTAKPQDDDIVRSKTIAKVTSTTVSTTYADGSYCVPCVLMAC